MGLSASMFSGISGLKGHGEKMGVIGNNLANVSTLGFKAARMFFEDAISQNIPTAAGIGQVGRGVGIGAIYADFSQGSFETTGEATDLAIGGEGFFMVRKSGEDTNLYTRAGDFRFDKDGYLVDPHGYILQGWEVAQSTPTTGAGSVTTGTGTSITGVPGDIRLDSFQSPPSATTNVTIVNNLNPSSGDKATDGTDPFFAMMKQWDGTSDPALATTMYGYSTTMKVFDANGGAHNLTVYFDKVDTPSAGGQIAWEYIVTCDPSEDGRDTSGAGGVDFSADAAGGLLMTGTMTFDSTGDLIGQTAYTPKSTMPTPANPKSLDNWTLADFSQNGLPVFTANFLGENTANFTDEAGARLIELDFGLKNTDLSGAPAGWNTAGGIDSADDLSTLGTGVLGSFSTFNNTRYSALATTSYESGSTTDSSTLFMSQDGYASGLLQGVEVSQDGILSGQYSNGQIIELFSITLADFSNPWGLRREGGNLFAETRDSGVAVTNEAGKGGKGIINSNSVEQSNVDMSDEFVQMITTQRGFEANGKVITTTDSLLGTVINLKR